MSLPLKQLKNIGYYALILFTFSIMAIFLMFCTYALPVEKIRTNVKDSMAEIYSSTIQNKYHQAKEEHLDKDKIDTFTDSLMLNNAAFLGRTPLYDALTNPRIHYTFLEYHNLNMAINNNNLSNNFIIHYPRFWHGYLTILKPLLIYFNLTQLRIIILLFQIALLSIILFLMYRSLGIRHCLAFVTALLFINPQTTWMCLEYCTTFNISLLSILTILLLKKTDNPLLFFIIGIIIAFFDFITFPLITLGFPLIICLSLHNKNLKEDISFAIKCCISWGSGYLGMLFSKWIFATLLTDQNVLADGWQNFLHRIHGEYENGFPIQNLTISNSILSNLSILNNFNSLMYSLLFIFGICLSYFFSPYRITKNIKALSILFVGLLPFIWLSIIINHSIIHPFIVYRIQSITVYALCTALICCLKPIKKQIKPKFLDKNKIIV